MRLRESGSENMKIESTDQDLRTMLSSAYYKIPRFQRPYSWDRENIQDYATEVLMEEAESDARV
jgi:hypothetical protein